MCREKKSKKPQISGTSGTLLNISDLSMKLSGTNMRLSGTLFIVNDLRKNYPVHCLF